jgi:hypothetical protein
VGYLEPGRDVVVAPNGSREERLLPLLLFVAVASRAEKAKSGPAAKTSAPVKVTSVEGITEYRLSNGLRVLLFPDPTQATVTVNLTYTVGSRHEGYGETGMAHLLEHLMFKGTPAHKVIPQEMKAHGENYNASTWFDRTNYFEVLPANEENLKFALGLEADRMIHSFIVQEREVGSGPLLFVSQTSGQRPDPNPLTASQGLRTGGWRLGTCRGVGRALPDLAAALAWPGVTF